MSALTEHLRFEPGETLEEHENGEPVVARVTDVAAGEETVTVTVGADELLDAATERLTDDYPSVHLWADSEVIAVTDHKETVDGAQAAALSSLDAGVHRFPVVDTHPEARRSLVSREALLTALDALDASTLTVHVEHDWPVVIEGDERAVSIAPLTYQNDD